MIPCIGVTHHTPVIRHTHRHHVWPVGMGGPGRGHPDEAGNVAQLCPNLHAATHQLLRITGARYDGDTPWWIRRHFPTAARDLAFDGWTAWDRAGRPVEQRRWLYQGARIAVDVLS